MTSYQKLKKRNQELINEIFILVNEPQTTSGIVTRMTVAMKWKIRFNIDKRIMFGDSKPTD